MTFVVGSSFSGAWYQVLRHVSVLFVGGMEREGRAGGEGGGEGGMEREGRAEEREGEREGEREDTCTLKARTVHCICSQIRDCLVA